LQFLKLTVQIFFLTFLDDVCARSRGPFIARAGHFANCRYQSIERSAVSSYLQVQYLERSVAVCRRFKSHLTSRLQACFTVHVHIWQTTSSVTYCIVGCVLTLPELTAYVCCNDLPLTGLFTYSYLLPTDCTFAGSNNVCTLVFGLWRIPIVIIYITEIRRI
jgi:hypothetical protein